MLKIVYKKIDELKPYENNPRINDKAVKAVSKSIADFGFKNPIVLDINNVIIEGHTRLKAAKELKLDKVPCIIADDLNEEQVQALRIVDNKTAELSEWDFELLATEVEDILSNDIDLEEFGFNVQEFIKENFEVFEDEYSEEEVSSRVKRGQKWQLGNNYLICGDATSPADLAFLMGDVKADLILTDPPYNVDYEGKTKDSLKIDNDSMSDDEFYIFLKNSFSNFYDYMKEGAAFYIWHADSKGYYFRKALIDISLEVRQCLIWLKNTMVLGRQDYQWKHEPCLYGWKEGKAHAWYSDRKQTTVLEFNKPARNGEHPTMKPVELFSYLIQNSSKKGDVVLDVFGGSGTTIIACEQLGRIGYSMELDEHYCDIIISRWEQLIGKEAILVDCRGDSN